MKDLDYAEVERLLVIIRRALGSATGASGFLRLNCSNDPLTGKLQIDLAGQGFSKEEILTLVGENDALIDLVAYVPTWGTGYEDLTASAIEQDASTNISWDTLNLYPDPVNGPNALGDTFMTRNNVKLYSRVATISYDAISLPATALVTGIKVTVPHKLAVGSTQLDELTLRFKLATANAGDAKMNLLTHIGSDLENIYYGGQFDDWNCGLTLANWASGNVKLTFQVYNPDNNGDGLSDNDCALWLDGIQVRVYYAIGGRWQAGAERATGKFIVEPIDDSGAGVIELRAAVSLLETLSVAGQITSTVAGGTPPAVVASNILVTNWNSDLLDGQHGSYYAVNGAAPTAHAASHVTGGGDTIADAVAGGASGLLSGADATKLGQYNPTAGKTLTVQENLTLAGASGKTLTLTGSLTVPADGTAALLGTANTFTTTQTIQPATDVVPLVVKASAAHTADLQDWYDKDGNLAVKITASGTRITFLKTGSGIYADTGDFTFSSAAGGIVRVQVGDGTADGGRLFVRSNGKDIVKLGDTGATNDGGLLMYNSDGTTQNVLIRSSGASYMAGGNVTIGSSVDANSARLQSVISDAGTNTTPNVTNWRHNTSGTAAAGFGVTELYSADSSTTANQSQAAWVTTWVVATHASRTAQIIGNVYDTAAREWIRGEASGSAAMIGFLGAAAVARQAHIANPTDLASALTSIASILSALETYGLLATS